MFIRILRSIGVATLLVALYLASAGPAIRFALEHAKGSMSRFVSSRGFYALTEPVRDRWPDYDAYLTSWNPAPS